MITLYWRDGELVIVDPTATGKTSMFEREMTYIHKSMVVNPKTYAKETKKEVVALTREVPGQAEKTLVTYQGFMDWAADLCKQYNLEYQILDQRAPFPKPQMNKAKGWWHTQFSSWMKFLSHNRSGLVKLPTRYGKCLNPETKVLMYNGTTKTAGEVVNGDLLMGPDSKPRKVSGVMCGRDQMYRITPNKGESWECTHDHILSLRCNFNEGKQSQKGDTNNVTVDAYITKSKNWKHLRKLWRTGVEFPNAKPVETPYVAGVYLGDGSRESNVITDNDPAVIQAVRDWCALKGLALTVTPYGNTFLLRFVDPTYIKAGKARDQIGAASEFRLQFLTPNLEEKYIPFEYLTANRQSRLELLAGLLDTDGSANNQMCYEITNKYTAVKDGILFLARSLGFAAYAKEKWVKLETWTEARCYWRIMINGAVEQIPVRSKRFNIKRKNKFDATNVGFNVEPIGMGDYAGFELDGDGLFLLGDFTVTHNTSLIVNTLRAFPELPTVLTAPGADLLGQLVDELKVALPNRKISGIFSGAKKPKGQCHDITVCSMDSLDKINPEGVRLVLVDEPHALVSPERVVQAQKFKNARILGFGATTEGRFDGADALLKGIVGPVLYEKSFKEAVADKAICDIRVYMLRVPFEPFPSRDRNHAYKELIFANDAFNNIVQRVSSEVIPADWQTLIFADQVKQIDLMDKCVENGTTAIASRMSAKERSEKFADMKSGLIKRCISTSIYSQGVTFPDLRAIINASGGGGSITGTQKPGRLAQRRPGKERGYLIDFLFVPKGWDDECDTRNVRDKWSMVVFDCQARMRTYKKTGFDVRVVNTIEEIKLT